MDYFTRLAERIEDAWQARNFNEEHFPEIAAAALERDPAHLSVTPTDIVDWVGRTRLLPLQADLASRFGQPPVTLAQGRGFHVDAYFWLDGTTSIHQHAFSGAFQVLAGSSVHGSYRFDPQETINLRLRLGEIRLKDIELLRVGDCRRIVGGAAFIHALFHLDRPSVTVVARTWSEANHSPQYEYLLPRVAVDPFYEEAHLKRRMEILNLLWHTDRVRFSRFLSETLSASDGFTAFTLLRQWMTRLKEAGLEADLLDQARRRQGAWFEGMEAVFAEAGRLSFLTEMRRRIHSPDHRFLLALFLNVPQRDMTLRLIHERYPDADGLTTLMRWLKELSELPSPLDKSEPNALGMPLEEDALLVLRSTLQGHSVRETIEAMAAEGYDAAELQSRTEEIESFREAFRGSKMFKTLFA